MSAAERQDFECGHMQSTTDREGKLNEETHSRHTVAGVSTCDVGE